MGLIAVLVQWRRREDPQTWEFGAALGTAIVSLLLLVVIEMTAVAHIEVPAVNGKVSFAVGLSSPNKPPCEGLGRDACITGKLGLDETKIDSYFGDLPTNLTKLFLLLTYIGFMSSFGIMVGLVIQRERSRPDAQ